MLSAGRGHHRSSHVAGEGHLIPGHQPAPDAVCAATSPHPPADVTEIVRLYDLRPWIEQSCKQIKDELGWADFQVRSNRAIPLASAPGQLHLLLLPGPTAHSTRTSGCHRTGPVPREGDQPPPRQHQQPCWPRALRTIHSWLAPAITLHQWQRAWTDKAPPAELQALINAITTEHGIDFYRRLDELPVVRRGEDRQDEGPAFGPGPHDGEADLVARPYLPGFEIRRQ